MSEQISEKNAFTYEEDCQHQAEFYGVSVLEIKSRMVNVHRKPRPETHRIFVRDKDGKATSKVVTDEEFQEMNTPKFSKPGKGDPLREFKGGTFGSDVRNTVFGNK